MSPGCLVTRRESASTRPVVFEVARATGAVYSDYPMYQSICTHLFPHPLLVRWTCAVSRRLLRCGRNRLHIWEMKELVVGRSSFVAKRNEIKDGAMGKVESSYLLIYFFW